MKTKKKILLFAGLFFIVFNVFGQARLGSYISEIEKEFPAEKYPIRNIGKNHGEGNGYHFYVRLEYADVAYFAEEDSFIVQTIVVPNDKDVWDYLINMYNEKYNKIDDKRWLTCFDSVKVANNIEIVDDENDFMHKLKGDYIKITFAEY